MALNNPRQRRFAELYIQLGNESEAAKRAGYAAGSAHTTGSRLLKDEKVRGYIRERMKAINKELQADSDEVMAFLAKVMRGEVKDQFGLDASLADRINAAKELNKRYAAADMIKGKPKLTIEFQGEEQWTN